LTLEETIERAVKFGYDAVDVFPHRPMAFPMDVPPDRRKKLVDLAGSRGIEFAAVEACTNFMMSDHILTMRQDKELLFVKECCKLAADLNCGLVRILAGFVGYFMHEHWHLGYTNTAMHSRNVDVSTEDDYLRQWRYARDGIREAGKIAADYGVTLALQNHPPITNSLQDTIDMVEEVGLPNVKIGLDLPLFEHQDDEFVRDSVLRVGDKMVHSHALGIKFKTSLAGPYGIEEVVPGEGRENWPAFLRACKEIGYDGHLAYEQCSPIILKGHQKATIEEVDRRFQAGREFLVPLMKEIGVYGQVERAVV
jgi:sugar phosphate isomerase/epimerase